MNLSDIPAHRLHMQRISHPILTSPAEVVAWLGAMQAQEYLEARWAVGLRMPTATDTAIEAAFNRGEILRTHLMRPTWHFVTPQDIGWMLMLTGPRVLNSLTYRYRQLEIDQATLVRINDLLITNLRGKNYLTRSDLRKIFEQDGISTTGQRMAFLIMCAELQGMICSGPRVGKQFSYALLEERAPERITLSREEALATLVQRYFTSHGPATARDFTWWSGLTQSDMQQGIALISDQLVEVTIAEKRMWYAPGEQPTREDSPTAHLLPPFDEYTIAYQFHDPTLNPGFIQDARTNLFGGTIVIDGQVLGYWQRDLSASSVILHLAPFRPLNPAEMDAVRIAAQRWSSFLELPVKIDLDSTL